ncbi:unnamed protein product [Brachionus calyciflorus]|uniref:Alkaline ceramidase n=1 Tax=Brachionus calyciflorus TaxID=104777 RepID=A0A813M5R2_9BILA|nr:unnamed protein product [Brachionus calyciflorus]
MGFFDPGTSAVDWCESNYQVHSSIAEFFNTVTNFLFFLGPPMMIFSFKNYSNLVTKGVYLIWFMLVIVGLGSVYFHSTLTMAGQLMDELSILWVIMTGYTILFPDMLLPLFFQKKRHLFYIVSGITTSLITYFGFLNPSLNAYCLMLASVPMMAVMKYLNKEASLKLKRLGNRTFVIWGLAVFFWVMDRLFCGLWLKLGIPYFHGIFHVLIYLASHRTIVYYAFFTAESRVPNLAPVLEYWPNLEKWDFMALPYVDFEFIKSNRNKTKNLIGAHRD